MKQRIVVACKRFVERGRRPSLLQGQPGYDFFAFDGPGETGPQFDYFARGVIRDKRYDTVVEGLAGFLYRRAQQIVRPNIVPLAPPPPVAEPPVTAPAHPDARKIYLAKPASDMRETYSRLVEELTRHGYAAVPDPKVDIPCDSTAKDFIDKVLTGVDVSIHLLGEGMGYTPEQSEPIAKLQLARAERMVAGGPDAGSAPRLRRIIWAPEVLNDIAEPSDANASHAIGAGEQAAADKRRVPQEVFARFGNFQSTDKVLGGSRSKFVDFLIDHLQQSDTGAATADEITEDDWVYVYHVPADTKYACEFIDALQQHGVAAYLPALEGEPAEVIRVHQQRLSECGAVVLCWAQATEAWAHARAHELKDWKKLGRQKRFVDRGLLAGPPPGERKAVFVKYPPPNEIDIIVNLADDSRPLAEAVDKFVHLARPHAQ